MISRRALLAAGAAFGPGFDRAREGAKLPRTDRSG